VGPWLEPALPTDRPRIIHGSESLSFSHGGHGNNDAFLHYIGYCSSVTLSTRAGLDVIYGKHKQKTCQRDTINSISSVQNSLSLLLEKTTILDTRTRQVTPALVSTKQSTTQQAINSRICFKCKGVEWGVLNDSDTCRMRGLPPPEPCQETKPASVTCQRTLPTHTGQGYHTEAFNQNNGPQRKSQVNQRMSSCFLANSQAIISFLTFIEH